MIIRTSLYAIAAATMVAGPALAPMAPAQAQIPAFLPNKADVPAGEALAIDGDWQVNTINKAIRIEGGRAYALEGWVHAFVLKVQPDMVTIRNIQQTAPDQFVGDDLPLMGKVTMRLVSPDRIEASVPGLFGTSRYTLTRIADASPRVFQGAPPASAPGYETSASDQAPLPQERYASLADAFGDPRPVSEAFRGCAIPDQAREAQPAPAPAASPRDRVTDRQFAPVASPETADPDDACWTRLDGVWVENREATFDTSLNDGREWDVQGLPLAGLLHGNYTTPETLFIAPGDDAANELFVMSGTGQVRFARYVATDATPVESLIGNVGARKVFQADGTAPLGGQLILDYTAGGTLRMRLGQRQFLRPPARQDSDLSRDDVFVIQYQTDNFAANLKGYNVLTQDPFDLINNPNGSVFARRDTAEYRIQEKYAVPFGFTLRNELMQGNVYRQTIVSSEREMQEANSSGYGVNANISASGAVNSILAFAGGGEIADTGYSVGYSATKSEMQALRNSQSVAQVVGYSRAKSYAIIVEHAETKLSADFLTAVGDAQNEGRYRDLIERFGTHYAYAVTYGANAKMTRDISNEAFSQTLEETEGDRLEGEARLLGSSIGGFTEGMSSTRDGYSGSIGNEGGRFVAVGGNGSWDQGGYSMGSRVAPILLDLRPIDELLNPINFPDQPDVYTRVRTELAQAVNRYLAGQARPLSNDRLIDRVTFTPKPKEEPVRTAAVEEWHVYVRHLNCRKVGVGTTKRVEGKIRITATGGSRSGFAPSKSLSTQCERGGNGKRTTFDYRARDGEPGLVILKGTRQELAQLQVKFNFNWEYGGLTGGKNRNSNRTLSSTPLQNGGLAPGEWHNTTWKVSPKARPEVKLYLHMKRVK